MQQQEVRASALEAVSQEHSSLHEGTLLRVAALERQVKDLQEQENHRSRSPAGSSRVRGGPRGSSQPRSPRDDRDPDEELELVFGGWIEGRRQDVEHEVNQIFQKTNMQDRLHAVIVPYVRVNICRVALKFPPNVVGIRAQRAFQTQTLARLKETKFLS